MMLVFSASFAFTNDKYTPTEMGISSLNIQEITYSPVNTNDGENFSEDLPKTRKAIELSKLKFTDTSNVQNRAVPHINIDNHIASLSNSNGVTSPCTLLAKVTVEYDNNNTGSVTTWHEITQQKTFIYNRLFVKQSATQFTITLYYVINDRRVVPNDVNEVLSLNISGSTDYYYFYTIGNPEIQFYSGVLTENINVATIPPSPVQEDTSLIITTQQPANWTNTFFFDNINTDVLVWSVFMQVGYNSSNVPNSNKLYQVGLQITSKNNFKLKNQQPTSGGKNEISYKLKLSKNSQQLIEVDNDDNIVIKNIKNNVNNKFNVYVNSDESTNNLNSGRYNDILYLNFITDITDTTWNNQWVKTIRLF